MISKTSVEKLDHFLDNGDDEEPEEEPGPEDHLLHDPMIKVNWREYRTTWSEGGIRGLMGLWPMDQCSKLSYHSKKAVYTA